ncbi:MAG: ATPase domain-containing protein, partial [Roseiflexaceae bacterium]
GFELALAPTFRTDFRESLYRLVGSLKNTGIIVLITMEIVQSSTDMRLSPYVISFLADNIILLRYIEIAGQLRKSLRVIKMRKSDHSKELRQYEITAQGMIVREALVDDSDLGAGTSAALVGGKLPAYPGLTEQEMVVLHALIELREAPAQALARRIGLPKGPILTSALDRLVSLNYATKRDRATGAIYRPVAQAI